MLLPNDSILNLWWTAVPIYEWEPVPPPAPATDADGAAADGAADTNCGDAPAGGTAGLPAMQLVFKGMRWTAVPVWTMRENAAWEQVAQDQRDEDELRKARARHAPRAPQPVDPAAGPQGSGDTANPATGDAG